jgi:hypothetical protein
LKNEIIHNDIRLITRDANMVRLLITKGLQMRGKFSGSRSNRSIERRRLLGSMSLNCGSHGLAPHHEANEEELHKQRH